MRSYIRALTTYLRTGKFNPLDKGDILYFDFLIGTIAFLSIGFVTFLLIYRDPASYSPLGGLFFYDLLFALGIHIGQGISSTYFIRKEKIVLAYLIRTISVSFLILYFTYCYGEKMNIHYFFIILGMDVFSFFPDKTKLALSMMAVCFSVFVVLLMVLGTYEPLVRSEDLPTVEKAGKVLLLALIPLFFFKALQVSISIDKNLRLTLANENEKLIAEKIRFEKVLNLSTNLILIEDQSGGKLFANQAVLDTLGLVEPQLILGLPDGMAEDKKELISRFIAAQGNFSLDIVNQSGKIQTHWYRKVKLVLKNENILHLAIDQTEIIIKRDILEKSENRYRTLFEASAEGILIVDIERGAAIDCNERMEELFKTDKAGIIAGNMLTFSPEFQPNGISTREALHELLIEFKEKQKVFQREWKFKAQDGSLFDAEVTFSPIELDDMQVSVMLVRDITEIRQARELLNWQMKELDITNKELKLYISSNMQLENFAYMASHDLKEPLRTITAFSQLLERDFGDTLGERGTKFLHFIIDASQNMHALISDLLTYSRVDTGDCYLEHVDLPALVSSTLKQIRGLTDDTGAKIHIGELPPAIYGDKTRIGQLLQNLLVNAIKFRKKGEIPEVHVSFEDSESFWTFCISDNGIGIPGEFKEKIFLLFRRLHTKEKYQGTGIGLALAKRIVEQHGGKIWFESEVGKGSVFYFSLMKEEYYPKPEPSLSK